MSYPYSGVREERAGSEENYIVHRLGPLLPPASATRLSTDIDRIHTFSGIYLLLALTRDASFASNFCGHSSTLPVIPSINMSNDDLLKLLEAHGQQFMQSFDVTISNGKRKHNPLDDNDQVSPKKRRQEASEEEWEGIGQGSDHSEHESSASEDIEDECEAMGDGM